MCHSGEDLHKQGGLQLFLVQELESSETKLTPEGDAGTSLSLCIIFQESEGRLACCEEDQACLVSELNHLLGFSVLKMVSVMSCPIDNSP